MRHAERVALDARLEELYARLLGLNRRAGRPGRVVAAARPQPRRHEAVPDRGAAGHRAGVGGRHQRLGGHPELGALGVRPRPRGGDVDLTGRFAPSPTGPLHLGNLRTALLAWLFARSAGAAVPPAPRGPRPGGDPRGARDRPAGRPGRPRPRLGRPGRAAVRAPGPLARRHRPADRRRPDLPLLLHPPRDPGGRLRPARRRAGEAPTRAPAATSPRRDRTTASPPVAGRPCGCGPAARSRASRTACTGGSRARSTTSCCAATTASRRTTWRWWSTTPPRAFGEVVRGDDLLGSTPRQVHLARLLDLEPPAYAHVPLVLGARRGPAGQAPRRGHPRRSACSGASRPRGWSASSPPPSAWPARGRT